MQLHVITPEKTVFAGEIAMVQIPGTLGDFGVLPGHMPFVSTLREGMLTIELADGGMRRMTVSGGIAEVTQDHCTVLADSAVET